MKVLTQKIFVVFLVSVQCSGVTEDFEADCTITDNIKKIVRRLRLSSSKPFGDDLDVNLFGTEEDKDINDADTDSKNNEYEHILLKHTKPKDESNRQKNKFKQNPKT